MLHGFVYVKFPEKENLQTESRLLAGSKSACEGSYWGDENVLKLDMVMDEPLSKCTKNH